MNFVVLLQYLPRMMGRRLVLFPFPFVGHQNPMFELGKILGARGFSISVIHTRFHAPDTAKHPDFSFHFIEDGLSEGEMSFDDIIATASTINEKCVEPFRACLSKILSDGSDQEPVACLVTDAILHFSQAVADRLMVPRIVLRTGNMSSFTIYTSHTDPKDMQPGDLIADRPPLRFEDLPRLCTGDQSPLHDLISDVVTETKASKGLIFNSFEEIEELSLAIMRQDYPISIFPVGPFHKCLPSCSSLPAQDRSSLSWLDTQAPNSVLYVSFGTLAAIDQAGFLEMAWGLANSNQPFLWVVRSDLVHSSAGSSQLPDEFLHKVSGRGHIVGWAPQKEVLAHPAVGGFWTHCGWNSTLESICEGVPMICSPSFADQMVDTRYVTEVWEIGLRLDKGAKREDVGKAISKLMSENEGGDMRKRAAGLKDKATNCLLPDGSSFKHMEDLVNLIMSF